MVRKQIAQADDDVIPELDASETIDIAALTAPKPAKPKRVKLRNTKAANGTVGAIANPLEKDAAAWLNIGWVKAD